MNTTENTTATANAIEKPNSIQAWKELNALLAGEGGDSPVFDDRYFYHPSISGGDAIVWRAGNGTLERAVIPSFTGYGLGGFPLPSVDSTYSGYLMAGQRTSTEEDFKARPNPRPALMAWIKWTYSQLESASWEPAKFPLDVWYCREKLRMIASLMHSALTP